MISTVIYCARVGSKRLGQRSNNSSIISSRDVNVVECRFKFAAIICYTKQASDLLTIVTQTFMVLITGKSFKWFESNLKQDLFNLKITKNAHCWTKKIEQWLFNFFLQSTKHWEGKFIYLQMKKTTVISRKWKWNWQRLRARC